ncbi:HutD/Ves family protein [Mesoterricola silvestris]|uniref:HutD family protein n=1 Tax=Mesoterricola silvestris TaxID=2927979 RepID=A0AA48KAA6_9BACT|nr:HutD family protein [Mesoterricola silvestris]BDU73910.1 hypothetical protein METEAL_30840 [Mesoterricola silvestris]
MRRLGPADYRAMPWKDGGGSTTELLIHPPGASLAGDFLWRISMADVPASGPFSRFPGVDRSLMVLSGALELDHGEHGTQLLEGPLRPVAFSGDWATSGRLLGGPCRDFNVLSARGRARHRLSVLAAPAPLPRAQVLVVVCLEGTLEIAGQVLGPLDLLEWEGGGEARGDGVMAVVELTTSS